MRTLPNLGLAGAFENGNDEWGGPMRDNLLKLSSLVQGAVLSRLAAVPANPAEGAMYVLTAAPNANAVATYDGGAWVYFAPKAGWLLYDLNAGKYITFSGSTWTELATGGSSGGGGGSSSRYAYQPPTIADFNIVLDENPGRQFSNQQGGIFLYSGQGYRTKTMAAKAPGRTNFRCRMRASVVSGTAEFFFVGLGIADAASPGNAIALSYQVSAYVFNLTRWEGSGNNAAEGNGGLPSIWNSTALWWQLEVTDTEIIGSISFDGGVWFRAGVLPRSRLPANVVVGPYIFTTPGNGGSQGLLISHFEVGPVDLAYPTLANV